MIRGRLSDEEWAFFAPFCHRGRPRCEAGRRATIGRTLDAVFWIARTGASWRDLPEGCVSSQA